MNQLSTALVQSPPLEKGGPTAIQGFDYQHNWAIYKLIELHQSDKEDYVLICEFHDDILVFESQSENIANFYQIKIKRDGYWTVSLLSGLQKNAPSILAKLYSKKVKFGHEGNIHLFLISNARYKIELEGNAKKGEDKKVIKCIEINSKDKTSIKEKIKNQLGLPTLPDFDLCTELHVSSLSLESPKDAIYTALLEYFQEKNLPIPNIKALYNALIVQIQRRASYNFEVSTNEELIQCRGVLRKDFDEYLQEALKPKYTEEELKTIFDNVNMLLNTPNQSRNTRLEFTNARTKYQTEKLNIENRTLSKVEMSIKQIMSKLSEEENNLPILQYREAVFNKMRSNKINTYNYDDSYLKFVILFVYYAEN